MFRISTLNKISSKGLDLLNEKYTLTENTEDADGILVRSQDMNSMELSPNLKAIARAGAGVNNIPLDKCSEKGIVVFNTPGANANAVKELVIAGLLMAARNLPKALSWTAALDENVSATVEKGKAQFAGTEISGKTLGIVGLGAIGKKVAVAANALGMNVLGFDPYFTGEAENLKIYSSIEEMLPECDYVTIHVPVTDGTKGMFDKCLLDKMKPSAVLLNFSRDKLVKDDDLLASIEAGKPAVYVTDFPNDVLAGKICQTEKDKICDLSEGNERCAINDKIIFLPHLGASTAEAEENCAVMATEQLMDYFQNGNIINSVNFPKTDMGPIKNFARIAFFTKGCQDPASSAASILKRNGIKVSTLLGGTKGNYGYALAETELSSVPDMEITEEYIIKHAVFNPEI